MADHLTEQQTAVLLSSMGRSVDGWHDACLTGDDILEALDAALKEAEREARAIRWSAERVVLAACAQTVRGNAGQDGRVREPP